MNHFLLITMTLMVMGCSTTPQPQQTNDPVTQAMAADDRNTADRERDARSRPDVTLKLLDIGPGDVVFDVFAGGGYYSDLIARIVGEDGKVYLHNNQSYRNFVNAALSQRMQQNSMPQLIQHDREVADLGIPAESLDAAMIIMSYHDLFYDDPANGWPQINHDDFMQQIYDGLKSGGRFMIVDHQAEDNRGALDSKTLHRIEADYAIEQLSQMGFRLVAESAVLANPADDKKQSVFAPDIRGQTDRFILVFEK